jgi:hypothetical protein
MKSIKKILHVIVLGLVVLAAPVVASAQANIVINNVDPPNVGFNDPTPALPVGGNIGVTVGEQRLIAYRYALDLWGARLVSGPAIVVQGSFAGLPCDASSGVLAQAGAIQVWVGLEPAGLPDTLYGSALANALLDFDIGAFFAGVPAAQPDPGPLAPPFNDEILANFNGNLGQPNCLAGSSWYYGLDNNPPQGGIDFLNTFMHEVAHGLGFQNFMNESTGTLLAGFQDIYTVFSYDNTVMKTHAEMTNAERLASSINSGNVVWIGDTVTAEAVNVLDYRQFLEIYAPASIAGEVAFGFANFGPAPTPGNFDNEVVLANDGAGASTSDGCEPLVNAVAGKIALIDRGTCAFVTKALNAQVAGAVGVMIANNAGGAIGLGGSSAAVTIPTIGIGQADGNAIKGVLPGVSVRLAVDATRLAGADVNNRVLLNAPNPVQPGSSISHYDPSAVPNLLMEPAITGTLIAATDVDLTDDLFQDIGWGVVFDPDLPANGADCGAAPAGPTVAALGCSTNVANIDVAGICKLADVVQKQVSDCSANAGTHGSVVSCVANSLNNMKRVGLINNNDQGEIQSCVAGADAP